MAAYLYHMQVYMYLDNYHGFGRKNKFVPTYVVAKFSIVFLIAQTLMKRQGQGSGRPEYMDHSYLLLQQFHTSLQRNLPISSMGLLSTYLVTMVLYISSCCWYRDL